MKILAELLLVGVLWLLVSRFAPKSIRGGIINVLKAWITVRAFWLLLEHPVRLADGTTVVAWELILDELQRLDARVFWTWVACATGIKFIGILASMYRWQLMLAGQRIELPFRHIFGSFLIGRFIGTFLPSTAGLDGYKLYDAARFSGRTVEVTAATVAREGPRRLRDLPVVPRRAAVRHQDLRRQRDARRGDHGADLGRRDRRLLTLLWFPGFVQWILRIVPIPGKAQLEGLVMRISRSAAAYARQEGLVLQALLLVLPRPLHDGGDVLLHGARGRRRRQGGVLAGRLRLVDPDLRDRPQPVTIAGDGTREAAQYVLLGQQIGAAAAIVSAALGFWAAEALTLFGGIFWWIRGAATTGRRTVAWTACRSTTSRPRARRRLACADRAGREARSRRGGAGIFVVGAYRTRSRHRPRRRHRRRHRAGRRRGLRDRERRLRRRCPGALVRTARVRAGARSGGLVGGGSSACFRWTTTRSAAGRRPW